LSDTPGEINGPGGVIGEHNVDVYGSELGLTGDEFERLTEAGSPVKETHRWNPGAPPSRRPTIGTSGFRDTTSTQLMASATFADVVFLLHKGQCRPRPNDGLVDAMLIAVADHGPGSPSAAAARTVASGNRAAPEAAIAAGVLAIGDAHGGAGLACLQLISDAMTESRASATDVTTIAGRVVDEARAGNRRLPGIGHRTHTRDPRTGVLFELARTGGLAGDGIAFMVALEAAAAESIKPLPINVDGAIAAVLYDLGFPPPIGKLFFIIGRVAGLSAQVVEEYSRERAMRIKSRSPTTARSPRTRRAQGRTVTAAARPRFRGPWIIAECFLTFGIASGFPYYNISFFFDYFRNDHGWTAQLITLGAPVAVLLTIWAGPFIVPRASPRWLIVSGTGLTFVAFQWFARLGGSRLEYFAAWCVWMLGYFLSGPIAHQIIISNWYCKHRGQAMGIAYVGGALLGAMGNKLNPWLVTFLPYTDALKVSAS
jgi:citrate synthase